jgi:hypothetical protein
MAKQDLSHQHDQCRDDAPVPGYLTTTAAGAILGVSGESVRRYVQQGRLDGVRPNRQTVLVSAASVAELRSSR